jgi:hypothetical protein
MDTGQAVVGEDLEPATKRTMQSMEFPGVWGAVLV